MLRWPLFLREQGIIISRFWLVGRETLPSFLCNVAFSSQEVAGKKFLGSFGKGCVSKWRNPSVHSLVVDADLSTFGRRKEERCSMNIPKAGGQTICAPIEYGRNTKRALMSRSQREWRPIRRCRRRRRRNGMSGGDSVRYSVRQQLPDPDYRHHHRTI